MVKASLSELVSGSMSKIRDVFSNIRLDKVSKPVAILGSGILFSILALSPIALAGVLPDVFSEVFNLAIKKYTKRKGVRAKITKETLKVMSVEDMGSLLVELQGSMDDLMREDKEARLQITRLIKESMRSEEFLEYLNEQQSLAVLIQENLRELLREFPEMSEDILEMGGKIDSLMDQVRDVKKLLIELRSDLREVMAKETGRRERRELKTRVAVTLGQMRASSNLPQAMTSAYETYYLKMTAEKIEDKQYQELIHKTSAWETDVAELTKKSARLVDARGGEFLLSREPLIIGRAPGYEEVRLEDKFISRVHACLMYDWKSGDYLIRDLNSTNGTFLNGREVENSPVRSGDEILMGRTSARVEIDRRLKILSATGLEHTLEGYIMVLGRSPNSKILVCKDPHVSRLHAMVTYDARKSSYRIRDLNSTNKTFVNNKRLTRDVALGNGDTISMAKTSHFTFVKGHDRSIHAES